MIHGGALAGNELIAMSVLEVSDLAWYASAYPTCDFGLLIIATVI